MTCALGRSRAGASPVTSLITSPANKAANRPQERNQGLITFPWWLAGPLLAVAVALAVHIGHTFWPWPTMPGTAPLARTLAEEAQLHTALLPPHAARLVQTSMREVRYWVLDITGLRRLIQRINTVPPAHERSVTGLTALVARPLADALHAFALSVQLISLRAAVLLIAYLPLGLLLLAMTVDGLVARDLRRRRAGVESGFIYHRAKRGLQWTYQAMWLGYLLPWWVMDPRWVLIPAILGLALATRIAAAWFKKRL